MKDSYSFDLDDDGLERSYQRHRDAYITAVRPARPAVRDRVGDVGRDGRLGVSEEFLAPLDVGEDTFVRCTIVRLRRQHRGGRRSPCRRPIPFDGAAGRASSHDTPDTPTIADPRRPPQRRDPTCAAPTATWTAADTLKNVVVKLRHPDGTARAAGDRRARRPRRRPEAARGAGRARPRSSRSPRGLRRQPGTWPRATSGPARSAPTSTSGIRYLVDPRDRRRHAVGHRRRQAGPPRDRPRRRPRLHAPTA